MFNINYWYEQHKNENTIEYNIINGLKKNQISEFIKYMDETYFENNTILYKYVNPIYYFVTIFNEFNEDLIKASMQLNSIINYSQKNELYEEKLVNIMKLFFNKEFNDKKNTGHLVGGPLRDG
jgi:hypothetical protein